MTVASYGATVEQLAKSMAVVAVLLYATGLLAVNGYLLQYDVSDFSLLRTKFMYTGGLIFFTALLPNAFIGGLALTVRDIARERKSKEDTARIAYVLISGLMLIIILVFLFDVVLDMVGRDPQRKDGLPLPVSLPSAILVGAGIGLGVLLFRLMLDISEAIRIAKTNRPTSVAFSFAYATLAIAACCLYVVIFMAVAYPRIPSQFGGGQPHEVRLLVTKEAVPAVEELGLSFPAKSQLSNPVQLLYEAEQQYVLRLSRSRTAVVNKDMVSALTT